MAATPAKKTAAKKTTAPRRSPRPRASKPIEDIPMPEIDVLDLRSEDADELQPDLVEIFRIDGKPYFIDRNRGAGVVMRLIKSIKTDGENAAVATMLTELLGEDAYEALASYRGLTAKHIYQVVLACQKAILGDAQTGPKA
ncbi:MAG TPA: hypothetical protein VGS97_20270 [Actinocrinis sp.]|uniref:hypothetical protein n=1 Tax=Actinocrinis sp. TaxID=1920516 RepID=UPI002DDD9527|nr:hypothetical protein [Actinocrinis sp.]HEV2346446.1 hypothetical protein [Actinocrinis sp.]